MMSKHTPGPWQIGNKNQHNASFVYAENGEDTVCMVYEIWSHRTVEECKDCKGMANARLIAAAPELLVELKKASAMLSRCGFESSDEYQSAMAAIAKAEGAQ
jgi:hypothetical protein